MYNLAKLLTDEPKKLERLIILFLKLLITLYITGALFDYKFTIDALIANPVPKSLTTSNLILFFISCIVVWFIFWNLLLEMICCELLVFLLTFKVNKRLISLFVLDLLNIVQVNGDTIIAPKKNIIDFTESLHEEKEKEEDELIRMKAQYTIAIGAFIVLVRSNSLAGWGYTISIIIILNLLVAILAYEIFEGFLAENHTTLLREFDTMAYSQKVWQAVSEHTLLKGNFEISRFKRRILLKRKGDYDWLPESILIETAFYWNKNLGQMYMESHAPTLTNNGKLVEGNKYFIIMSNIPVSDLISKSIYQQDKLIYIMGETEEEIYTGMEAAYHRIQESYRLAGKSLPATGENEIGSIEA